MKIPKQKAGPILKHFRQASKKVYRRIELASLLSEYRETWRLSSTMNGKAFIDFLKNKGSLQAITVPSEGPYTSINRYVWEDASPFEVALSLKKNSYFTHSTAVFLHGLTDQIPQTLYVNVEQSKKPKPSGKLTQESLDRAFRGSQRSSRYVFTYENSRFVLLSGKNTGRYGVITLPGDEQTPTTSIERTLVDIIVRPVYGGGVHQIMSTYQAAAHKISVGKILATLRSLDYVYPYHQAIGFLLEKAGVSSKHLKRLRALGTNFNFYLSHGIKNPQFDESWRVFYPKSF